MIDSIRFNKPAFFVSVAAANVFTRSNKPFALYALCRLFLDVAYPLPLAFDDEQSVYSGIQ